MELEDEGKRVEGIKVSVQLKIYKFTHHHPLENHHSSNELLLIEPVEILPVSANSLVLFNKDGLQTIGEVYLVDYKTALRSKIFAPLRGLLSLLRGRARCTFLRGH